MDTATTIPAEAFHFLTKEGIPDHTAAWLIGSAIEGNEGIGYGTSYEDPAGGDCATVDFQDGVLECTVNFTTRTFKV